MRRFGLGSAKGLLALLALASACSRADIDPMKVQPRLRAYGPSDFFVDRRAMQSPPVGTIPREAPAGDPSRSTGLSDGEPITSIPIPITRELLLRGRNRYDIACTPCHGILGDGHGPVSTKMGLRTPPSLHARPIVSGLSLTAARSGRRAWLGAPESAAEPGPLSPGATFEIITKGYGLMPSYEAMLAPDDRWAIVAYVQALQRSQNARLGDVPESEQQQLLGQRGHSDRSYRPEERHPESQEGLAPERAGQAPGPGEAAPTGAQNKDQQR